MVCACVAPSLTRYFARQGLKKAEQQKLIADVRALGGLVGSADSPLPAPAAMSGAGPAHDNEPTAADIMKNPMKAIKGVFDRIVD